jgi:hypothetical protein
MIGARLRNSCVPGSGLDPLIPNSMRRGLTSCGAVLAGGGGWASGPTEGGGYWHQVALSGPILVTTVVGLAIFLVAVLLSPETKGKVLVADLTVA